MCQRVRAWVGEWVSRSLWDRRNVQIINQWPTIWIKAQGEDRNEWKVEWIESNQSTFKTNQLISKRLTFRCWQDKKGWANERATNTVKALKGSCNRMTTRWCKVPFKVRTRRFNLCRCAKGLHSMQDSATAVMLCDRMRFLDWTAAEEDSVGENSLMMKRLMDEREKQRKQMPAAVARQQTHKLSIKGKNKTSLWWWCWWKKSADTNVLRADIHTEKRREREKKWIRWQTSLPNESRSWKQASWWCSWWCLEKLPGNGKEGRQHPHTHQCELKFQTHFLFLLLLCGEDRPEAADQNQTSEAKVDQLNLLHLIKMCVWVNLISKNVISKHKCSLLLHVWSGRPASQSKRNDFLEAFWLIFTLDYKNGNYCKVFNWNEKEISLNFAQTRDDQNMEICGRMRKRIGH